MIRKRKEKGLVARSAEKEEPGRSPQAFWRRGEDRRFRLPWKSRKTSSFERKRKISDNVTPEEKRKKVEDLVDSKRRLCLAGTVYVPTGKRRSRPNGSSAGSPKGGRRTLLQKTERKGSPLNNLVEGPSCPYIRHR